MVQIKKKKKVINWRGFPNTNSKLPYLPNLWCEITVNIDHLYLLFLTFNIWFFYDLFS